MMTEDRVELLVQVAWWYYNNEESLEAIGRRINRSASMVSRMLKEARERELVEIRIRFPLPGAGPLEEALREAFGLSAAYVLADSASRDATTAQRLGELAARHLADRWREGVSVGLGWGTHVAEFVDAVPFQPLAKATVVQVSGASAHGAPAFNGAQLTRRLADKLHAGASFLHAPLIVGSAAMAKALREDPANARTLKAARRCNCVVVGVGAARDERLVDAGVLAPADLAESTAAGSVGDVVGWHLDENGDPLSIDLNARIVGISPADLRSIPDVVAIAHGAEKTRGLLAALRGRYVKTLVTDEATARRVLKQPTSRRPAAN